VATYFEPNNKPLRWILCLLAGVYLNVFILLFEPYHGDIFTYSSPSYYQFVFGGIVSAVFIFTGIILPDLLPHLFVAPYFNFKRFIAWFFMSILLTHIPSFFYDN
jgi:hypothetical protein